MKHNIVQDHQVVMKGEAKYWNRQFKFALKNSSLGQVKGAILKLEELYETQIDMQLNICGAQWLRGRVADSRLQESGFESCAAVFKTLGKFYHSTLLQYTQLYK